MKEEGLAGRRGPKGMKEAFDRLTDTFVTRPFRRYAGHGLLDDRINTIYGKQCDGLMGISGEDFHSMVLAVGDKAIPIDLAQFIDGMAMLVVPAVLVAVGGGVTGFFILTMYRSEADLVVVMVVRTDRVQDHHQGSSEKEDKCYVP